MTISAVCLIPDARKDLANAMFAAIGWGPFALSIALSANGQVPASHWGMNYTAAPDDFQLWVEAAQADGTMPAELVAAEFPAEDFAEVVTSLVTSFEPDNEGHFSSVITAQGLQLVIEEA